MLNKTSLSCF